MVVSSLFKMVGTSVGIPALLSGAVSLPPGNTSSTIPYPVPYPDGTVAENVMPPGENGFISTAAYAEGATNPNYSDQLALYQNYQYKPFQFSAPGTPTVIDGAKIYTDTYGVPHIYAPSVNQAEYAAGYESGTLRLFETEILRHLAEGTLSSIAGPQYLTEDETTRELYYPTSVLKAEYNLLPPFEQAALQNYVDGLNLAVFDANTNPMKTPFEFVAYGDYPIKPFTVMDVLRIDTMMAQSFDGGGQQMINASAYEDLVLKYGQKKGAALFNDANWRNDPAAPTTVPASDGSFPTEYTHGHTPRTSPAPDQLLPDATQAAVAQMSLNATLQQIFSKFPAPHFGSNAWVVSPSRTANGDAMLYGAPELGYYDPSIFLEMEMNAPGLHATGITFPGAGGIVLIGHGAHSAWTVTSGLWSDEDVVAEKLEPGKPTYYLHDGQWMPMSKMTQTFIVRSAPPQIASNPTQIPVNVVRQTDYSTVDGPVIFNDPADGYAYSLKISSYPHALDAITAFYDIDRAQNIQQFENAVKLIPIPINLYYADGKGNIGYWMCGRQPIRDARLGVRFPTPGWKDDGWAGVMPFGAMAHDVNPPQGWLANWNNKPATGVDNEGGPFLWSATHHVEAIFQHLEHLHNATMADMATIGKDVAIEDTRTIYFKQMLLDAAQQSDDARLRQAASLVSAWDNTRTDQDGDGKYDAPGLAIFDKWMQLLTQNTFEPLFGQTDYERFLHAPTSWTSTTNETMPTFKLETPVYGYLYHVLQGSNSTVPLQYQDYFGGFTRTEYLNKTLTQALDDLTKQYGTSDMSQWLAPVEYDDWTVLSAGSVGKLETSNRGSYQQVVDLKSES